MSIRPLSLSRGEAIAALIAVGVPAAALVVAISPAGGNYGYDFLIFRTAGDAYLHGHSPYPPAELAVLAKQHSFVYPAPMAALFAPFALLPAHAASILFAVIAAACAFATLRLLDVRDLRVYGTAALWLPVLSGIRLGTISPLVALLVAGLWRFRDRPRVASLFLAAVLVTKLFVWPLAAWLVLTRRWRAAGGGLLIAAAVTLVAWAPIGFAGLRSYPHLLSVLAQAEQVQSFSVVSLALAAGLGSFGAHALAVLAGAALLGLALLLRLRRGHGRSDFGVFALCLGAALAASPLVWNHYFVLLLVPLAIAAPRFGAIWVLPLVLWVVPLQSHGHQGLIAVAVAVPAVTLAWAIAVRRHLRNEEAGSSGPPTKEEITMLDRFRRAAVPRVLRLLAAREDGQALVEYALILSLIALVAFGVLQLAGAHVNNMINNVAGDL